MTIQDMFNREQLKWYEKRVEEATEEINTLTRYIKEYKESIKRSREYVWNQGVIQRWELEYYGKPSTPIDFYNFKELYDWICERNRKYADRKWFKKQVEHYTELVNA